MAIYGWLQVEELNFYCGMTLKLIRRWDKCSNMLKGSAEK
jgi:hypothetical protein